MPWNRFESLDLRTLDAKVRYLVEFAGLHGPLDVGASCWPMMQQLQGMVQRI